jgi:hypothetical protein
MVIVLRAVSPWVCIAMSDGLERESRAVYMATSSARMIVRVLSLPLASM